MTARLLDIHLHIHIYMYILNFFSSLNEKFDVGCRITVPINIWPGSWITSHQRNHGNDGGDLLQTCRNFQLFIIWKLYYLCTNWFIFLIFFFFCIKNGFFPLIQNFTRKCRAQCYFFSLFLYLAWNGYGFWLRMKYEYMEAYTIWSPKIKYIPEQSRFASTCNDKAYIFYIERDISLIRSSPVVNMNAFCFLLLLGQLALSSGFLVSFFLHVH